LTSDGAPIYHYLQRDEAKLVLGHPFIRRSIKRTSYSFTLFTSALVQEEIAYAPAEVRELFSELIESMEILDVNEPALKLRDAYLKARIVPAKFSNDALHVAIASVSRCPIIVSWNFKHIVHFEKITSYNTVNILEGYSQVSIYSPSEVIRYG
jgi:hypothetical protein